MTSLSSRVSHPRRLIFSALAATLTAGTAVTLAAPPAPYTRPGSTSRVNVGPNGAQADHLPSTTADLTSSRVSSNGRYVVFASNAMNLVSPTTKGTNIGQVYRRDLTTGVTRRVSVAGDGSAGNGDSSSPSISADGRYVAFESNATNLVPGDSNETTDIFRHDMTTGVTLRVSVSSDGAQAVNTARPPRWSARPSISGDGQRVSFSSAATNFAPGVEQHAKACQCSFVAMYLRDVRSRKTSLVSIGQDGKVGWGDIGSISGNGRYVAFTSGDPLVPGVRRSKAEVYVRDVSAGKTTLVSVASDGRRATERGELNCDGDASAPSILEQVREVLDGPLRLYCPLSTTYGYGGGAGGALSDDGRFVTFLSTATNLVPNMGGCSGAAPAGCAAGVATFVHDLRTGRTERLDVTSYGQPRDRQNVIGFGQVISGDGRFAGYGYMAPTDEPTCTTGLPVLPLVPEVTLPVKLPCWTTQVYVYDRLAGSMEWISKSMTDTQVKPGQCTALDPAVTPEAQLGGLSRDGRFVSFSSCGQDLVAHDTNNHIDTFVRDRGPTVGVGGMGEPAPAGPAPAACIIEPICLVPLLADDRVGDTTVSGADLTGARVVARPTLKDLWLRWDLQELPAVAGVPTVGVLYGMSFTAGGTRYEVRAQRVLGLDYDAKGGASFGLFRQDAATGQYLKVATLKGGYGTIGESVAAAVPLAALGLAEDGKLSDVTAFTSVGSYLTGATRLLDTIRLAP